MATYYIDPVSGNNANAGTLVAPKLTQKGFDSAPAITLADGDRIGIMNTGSLDIGTTANTYTISKNVTIFGCDTSGNPANATLTSGANTVRRHITAIAGSTITWENIFFDFSSRTADTNVIDIVWYNGSTGKMTWKGCKLKASALGGSAAAARRALQNMQSNPGTGVVVADFQYCYFENSSNFGSWNAVNNESMDHCVFINDLPSIAGFTKNVNASGLGFTYTNCTEYQVVGAAAVGAPVALSMVGGSLNASIHSNLVYEDSTLASTLIGFVRDSAGIATLTGNIGWNGLFAGPNVLTAGELYSAGWYERKFDPDGNDASGSDTYLTDVVALGVVATDLFNNPSGTYNWPTFNGVTITLPKDLRPRLYLTSSFSAGVLGALPAASTDYSVTASTDNSAPEPGDTVTVTLTHTNTGTSATGITAAVTVPADLSVLTATPTVGTFVGSTWTIGSQASAATATLTLVCEAAATIANGQNLSVTITHGAGDPTVDTDSSNNSATATIMGFIPPSSDPTLVPYLDVAPIFAPVLLAEINASVEAKRNRLSHVFNRHDVEKRIWREYTGRRVIVAPSTTVQVISSIERVEHLILEATADIEVSLSDGSTDHYLPAARRMALLGGSFTTLKLRNPSASSSVTVLLVVID